MQRKSEISFSSDFHSIRKIFLDPNVTSDYSLKWSRPNEEKIVAFLCDERDFSEERVRKAVSRMMASAPKAKATLESYFG